LNLNTGFDIRFGKKTQYARGLVSHFIAVIVVEVAVVENKLEVFKKGSCSFGTSTVLPFSDFGPHLAKIHGKFDNFAVAGSLFVVHFSGENRIPVVPANTLSKNEYLWFQLNMHTMIAHKKLTCSFCPE